MTLLVTWVVAPLVLGALAAGCGMLAARVSGIQLPGSLVVPVGLSAVVIVAGFFTVAGPTAELAPPAVLGVAVVGALLGYRRRRLGAERERRWHAVAPPAVAAVAMFLVYAAPVVLSGEATFAGYVKLDDTATWLAQADQVMHHGRSLDGLPPSSYEATLHSYVGHGYPVGAMLPLGVAGAISGEDVAWVFQPYLAFLAANLALALWALLEPVVEDRWLRTLTAAIAAQPALLFGYALWGGVKELLAAAMLATLAALVPVTVSSLSRDRPSWRAPVCLALPCAGLLAALSLGGLAWVGPALLVSAPAVVFGLGRSGALRQGFRLAVLIVALAAPSFAGANLFVQSGATVLTSGSELGNLVAPLDPLQVLGVWLAGDFRAPPVDRGPTNVLLMAVALAALGGVALVRRRRATGMSAYLGAAALGAAGLAVVGSPWVAGKGFATASPAFLLAAMAAACWLLQRGRRVEGAVLALAIGGGVLASNFLAYHDVWLAPRDSLVELEVIGKRIAGQGPTLMTSFEPFGVRHFLRAADPEGASELRRRRIPLRDGSLLPKGETADIDRFRLPDVLTYRTLVLRRSPLASRPPSPYRLIWRGHVWEVWQRPAGAGATILEHFALGRGRQPASRAPCGEVRRLAMEAGSRGTLAVATRPQALVVELGGRDRLAARIVVPVAGHWSVWLGGSFKPLVDVYVDGRRVGEARGRIDHAGAIWRLGQADLRAGPAALTVRADRPDWRPGSGGASLPAGPLVLARPASDKVALVPARDWRRLCGRALDWIEALGPAA